MAGSERQPKEKMKALEKDILESLKRRDYDNLHLSEPATSYVWARWDEEFGFWKFLVIEVWEDK